MPTPLPHANTPEVQCIANENPENLSTYNICLSYEQEVAASNNLKDSDKRHKLRHVRILGFLLLHAPNQGVRDEVIRSIRLCKPEGGSDLAVVGGFFQRYFILPFKKYKGRTPKPTEHPSNHTFELVKDEAKDDITQPPRDHKEAKYRALIRDKWRCVVTGVFDRKVPSEVAQLDATSHAVATHCAHIIPESTFFNVESASEENLKMFDHFASVLAVLRRFGYDTDGFNGKEVHSLNNVMTLESNVHDAFDQLMLYFEATSQKDCYEIKCYVPKPHPYMRQFVEFSTPDPEKLPVPASNLLALHATCCKVAHLSGAGEYIDEVHRDADGLGVLSADGTSGDILDYMLLSLSNPLAVTVGPEPSNLQHHKQASQSIVI